MREKNHGDIYKMIQQGGSIMLLLALWGCGPLYQPGMVREGKNLAAPIEPPSQAQARPSYWQVEKNIALYHFEQGQGPVVLVIHGGPGFPPLKPWTGLQLLSQQYQFVYYHQRGCGKSTRPLDTFSSKNYYQNMLAMDKALGLGAQIADIERIRRILKQDQLVILGHSFGGFIAALYASEFPGHVKKLVLIAPADCLKMPSPKNAGLYYWVGQRLMDKTTQAAYQEYLKRYFDYGRLFEKNEKQLAELNLEFGKYYSLAEKALSLPAYTVEDTGGWVTPALFFSMGQKHDYRKSLKQITAPTLIVHGSQDLIPFTSVRDYRAAILKNQFKIIENAGHMIYEDQPQALADVLKSFLEE